jgi:predicted RNase H-like HicB family nuclease
MINAIEIIAAREGKTPEKIREAIQEALELAWASGDSNHIQARKTLTDSPTAPNPEDFIAAVAKEVQNRR